MLHLRKCFLTPDRNVGNLVLHFLQRLRFAGADFMINQGADEMLQLRVVSEALMSFLPGCFAMLNDALLTCPQY